MRFAVSDTGIGIDQHQAADLFEPFSQGDLSTTRKFGGTGLGLTISRQLVERMGGEIGAEPRPDGGSVFYFTAALPAAEKAGELPTERPELLGLRALIVDDNSTNRTILEHYMRAWGLACESVGGSAAALGALETAVERGRPFEVVVLDYDMPDMNGIELAAAIRKRPSLRALNLVMLSSAQVGPSTRSQHGIAALLSKPPRQSDLYNAIADAVTGVAEIAEPTAVAQISSDPDGPLVLVAEDNEINRAVAKALLAKRGLRTETARNGLEAVQMALENEYAAILMDCQMPELDGYEATRRIRAAEHDRHVPIIAMTAHSMKGDRERCLAAGMDDYLSKPVRNDQLDAAIGRWLGADPRDASGLTNGDADEDAGRGRSRRAGDVREASAADLGDEVLDDATVGQLRNTLTPKMRARLLETFEESQGACLKEIAAAIERRDDGELRRVAHLLKGSSAMLGATRLKRACQSLEQSSRNGDPRPSEEEVAQLRVIAADGLAALRQHLL